jgi:hypothetical protein
MIVAVALHFLLRKQTTTWAATILSMAFVLTLPFLMVVTAAYAEPLILVQFIGMFFVLGRISHTGRTGDWLMLGFFAGFAASVKLTGAILPAALSLLLAFKVLRGREGRQPRSLLTKVGAFLGPLLLVIALFYSRPLLATGNPLYPYFAPLFTNKEATLEMSRYHHDAGRAKFGVPFEWSGEAILYYCWTPVLLTADSVSEPAIFELPLGLDKLFSLLRPATPTPINYDGTFGLQFLMLIGLIATAIASAIRHRRIDRRLLTCLVFAVLFYTFWFFTAQQSRFLLHGLLCLVLASSFALPLLMPWARWIVLGLILVLSLGNLPMRLVKQITLGWESLATGKGTAEEFIAAATQDGYLHACRTIRDHTPSSAETKILLLYEQRGLYISRPYMIGTPYFQEQMSTPPAKTTTADEFMETLRREKITHVLVGYSPKDPDRMQKYMDLGKPIQDRIKECDQQMRLRRIWVLVDEKSAVVEFALFEVDNKDR